MSDPQLDEMHPIEAIWHERVKQDAKFREQEERDDCEV